MILSCAHTHGTHNVQPTNYTLTLTENTSRKTVAVGNGTREIDSHMAKA